MCLLLGKRRRVPFAVVYSQPGVVCSEKVTCDPLTFSKKNPSRAIPRSNFIHPPRTPTKGFGEDPSKDLGGVGEQTNKQTNAARIIVWCSKVWGGKGLMPWITIYERTLAYGDKLQLNLVFKPNKRKAAYRERNAGCLQSTLCSNYQQEKIVWENIMTMCWWYWRTVPLSHILH